MTLGLFEFQTHNGLNASGATVGHFASRSRRLDRALLNGSLVGEEDLHLIEEALERDEVELEEHHVAIDELEDRPVSVYRRKLSPT